MASAEEPVVRWDGDAEGCCTGCRPRVPQAGKHMTGRELRLAAGSGDSAPV
jgi:hypothetical protein